MVQYQQAILQVWGLVRGRGGTVIPINLAPEPEGKRGGLLYIVATVHRKKGEVKSSLWNWPTSKTRKKRRGPGSGQFFLIRRLREKKKKESGKKLSCCISNLGYRKRGKGRWPANGVRTVIYTLVFDCLVGEGERPFSPVRGINYGWKLAEGKKHRLFTSPGRLEGRGGGHGSPAIITRQYRRGKRKG